MYATRALARRLPRAWSKPPAGMKEAGIALPSNAIARFGRFRTSLL
jgi:hypothetical protein